MCITGKKARSFLPANTFFKGFAKGGAGEIECAERDDAFEVITLNRNNKRGNSFPTTPCEDGFFLQAAYMKNCTYKCDVPKNWGKMVVELIFGVQNSLTKIGIENKVVGLMGKIVRHYNTGKGKYGVNCNDDYGSPGLEFVCSRRKFN